MVVLGRAHKWRGGEGCLGSDHDFCSKTTTSCFCLHLIPKSPKRVKTQKKLFNLYVLFYLGVVKDRLSVQTPNCFRGKIEKKINFSIDQLFFPYQVILSKNFPQQKVAV